MITFVMQNFHIRKESGQYIILTEGVAMLREGTPVLLREDDEQTAATIDQTDVIEE